MLQALRLLVQERLQKRSFSNKQQSNRIENNEALRRIVSKIDKNYIKDSETYIFQINHTKMVVENRFHNNRVKLLGAISVKNSLFSMRIQFLDEKGLKIIAKSTYHRALLSSLILQINAELQNCKIEYNPVLGEFSFVFSIKCSTSQPTVMGQIIEFGLKCYFEQFSAHFYLLNLIEFNDKANNKYLKNIEENISMIKTWTQE